MVGLSSTTTVGVVLLILGALFLLVAIITAVTGSTIIFTLNSGARRPTAILGGILMIIGLIFSLIDPISAFSNNNVSQKPIPTANVTPATTEPSKVTPTPKPTSILITSPTDGSKVPILTIVQGTASGIPEGEDLWVLIVPDGVTAYYPQSGPIVVTSDGKWSSSARVGIASDTGLGFTLIAALADQEGRAA